MSTKAERIAQRIVDVALTGFVESEIEAAVDLRVVVEVVDGRRDDAILQGQHCGDGLDGTGHSKGWYSPDYYEYLSRLDACIGRIIQALKDAGIYDETVSIVTGDHGGPDKGHGTLAMEDMESPLVIFGPHVKRDYQIEAPVVQYDVAATIAYVLGIELPQVWRGKPVKEAFR